MPPRAPLRKSGAERNSSLRLLQLTAPGRFGSLETVVRQLSAGLRTVRQGSAGPLFAVFDFVLSHRTEGTPMMSFEAMNAGAPSGASDRAERR